MSDFNLPHVVSTSTKSIQFECSPSDIPENGPEQTAYKQLAYKQATEYFTKAVATLWHAGFWPEDATRLLDNIWDDYDTEQEAKL